MIIEKEFIEISRKAKTGCIKSLFGLANCHNQGLYGLKESPEQYRKALLSLLNKVEEIRESKYSSAVIYYELMYIYLDEGNKIMADEYHHYLMWEIMQDYPSGDLEPFFKEYQVREIAEYLGKEVEHILDEVKEFQSIYDPEAYKVLDVNHFFTI